MILVTFAGTGVSVLMSYTVILSPTYNWFLFSNINSYVPGDTKSILNIEYLEGVL